MSVSIAESVGTDLEIAFPPRIHSLPQDHEWCVVHWENEWHKVLIHDYETIFSIPGFYEQLIYDVLDCRSPEVVRDLLQAELSAAGVQAASLHTLDLGAGNGMVGEELSNMGIGSIIGIDIIHAAAEAAERDRPDVYEDYLVADLSSPSDGDLRRLHRDRLNCLVCVAALGFGDIPLSAFVNAFNVIEPGGWVAFNIKEEFLAESDRTGFSKLIRLLETTGALTIRNKHRYQHRLGTDGEPIHYIAVVGRKMSDAPKTSVLGQPAHGALNSPGTNNDHR